MTSEAPQSDQSIESTIHGLNYLTQRSSIPEKVFWIFSIAVVSCGFAYLSFEITSKFLSAQTSMKISKQQFPITEVPFPAFTVCPEVICDPEHEDISEGVYEVLGYHNDLNTSNYDTKNFITDLKNRTQYDWFETSVFCRWQTQYAVMMSSILTKHGICFTFNMQPAETLLHLDKVSEDFYYSYDIEVEPYEDNSPIPNLTMPWKASGDTYELAMSFFREQEIEYINSNMFQPLKGIHVMIHSPDEFPIQTSESLHIEPRIDFDPTITPEIIFIADELKAWSIKDRNCYLPGEKKLEYFQIYTKNNCDQECFSEAANKTCGCVPFYLIRGRFERICSLNQQECLTSVEVLFNEKLKADCECLNPCNQINYKVKSVREGFPLRRSRLYATVENVIYPLIRHRDFGSEDFFGSLGGLMGLFAGISVISIIEVCFQAALSAFGRVTKKLKKNKVHAMQSTHLLKNVAINREHVLYQCSVFFHTFIGRSDIQGLHYITDKHKTMAERIFWAITVLVSTVFCFFLIFDMTKSSELNPIEFGVDAKIWALEDIPFPTVHLCLDMDIDKYEDLYDCVHYERCENLTQELRQKVDSGEIGELDLEPLTRLYRDWDVDEKRADALPLVTPIMPKLRLFERSFIFKNQSFCFSNQKSIELVEKIAEPGICYRFNADEGILNSEVTSSDFTETKRFTAHCRTEESMQKKGHTLSIELRTYRKKYGIFLIGAFLLQSPNEFMYDSFRALLKWKFSRIVITPVITTTDESLRKYSPQQRNCFFSDEGHLKYFKKYTQSSCIEECRSNFTSELCGCIPLFVIRGENDRVCSKKDQVCEFNVHQATLRSDSTTLKSCNCLPECNKIKYNSDVLVDHFVPENLTRFEFAAVASFYFADNDFTAYRRYESYGTVGLLSNIGGYLGLFLGISVLSLVEIVYFFTLRFVDDLWHTPDAL